MLKNKLDGLRNHIIGQHDYFNNSYSDVVKGTTGIVHNGKEIVFPADNLGDYFYLRMANFGSLVYDSRFALSNQTSGIGSSSEVFLVACVRNADADILLENLINSIRVYQTENIRLTRFIQQGEYVILQELQGLGEEVIEGALKRLSPDFTIVSLSLTYSFPIKFTKSNCYEKPCSTC